ncbi:MAG TPA: carboxylating nicotinate-nucleotide diphosphorylase [Candidatus Deferrimicrobium sp.]|nr:carboxylating nicotinate-nucleotide diphosphorylase [Candidatus Deferrimicrobium sp.]
MQPLEKATLYLVRAALEEDIGKGDLTSLACLDSNPVTAEIVAKSDGVLSAMRPAMLSFQIVDSSTVVRPLISDGARFEPGDTIAVIEGFDQPILTAERTALNFLAHLSGVATMTAQFVDRVRGASCRILDTRKTTPGWRLLEKQAVVHGGGMNHRVGLYDLILVKDNHIAAAGSVTEAVTRARRYITSDDYRLQFGSDDRLIEIEVEVTDEKQLAEATAAGADRLLLDNQTPDSLRRLVVLARQLNPQLILEASGNVTLDNVGDIAATGVDFVSVGALTHSAPACDFSLRIVRV